MDICFRLEIYFFYLLFTFNISIFCYNRIMLGRLENLRKSFSIVNSLLIFVFILFLAEKLNLSFFFQFGFIFVFLITGALKIYCLSGLGGCLLEILSGEEPVIRVRRIHQNALQLWPGFLIVFVLVRLVDFLLFVLFPSLRVWRDIFFPMLETTAIFALAQWTINRKYQDPCFRRNDNQREIQIGKWLGLLTVMISVYFLELTFAKVGSLHLAIFNLQSLASFMLNYTYVFGFIFCSMFLLNRRPEIKTHFDQQKEIFLISPMGAEIVRSLASWFFPGNPPVFMVLKALSPQTYKFREFNRIIWHDRYYKSNVLVCITCYTSNCYEAYKIAKEFKKRGSTVVMGGPHVTYLPDEALAFCDSVVVGAAEGVWKDVICDHENGGLQAKYQGVATDADHAKVHEALLASAPSITKDYLETIRGCKFRCHFCTIPDLSGRQLRMAPINDVVQLLKKIRPRYRHIVFIDNNIYADPSHAKELFAALKPLKIKWHSACSIDIAANPETLKQARESGCDVLFFGYEIFNGSAEENQGGKFAMTKKYIEYTRLVKKTGIAIKAGFIFGFDSDNLKTLFSLWKFCFSLMPRYTSLSVLTPLPGSGVYRDMLAQNRIISLNWRSYTGTSKLVVSHPQLNTTLLSFFFPWIQMFFLMTTSSFGLMFWVFFLSLISYEKMHHYFLKWVLF